MKSLPSSVLAYVLMSMYKLCVKVEKKKEDEVYFFFLYCSFPDPHFFFCCKLVSVVDPVASHSPRLLVAQLFGPLFISAVCCCGVFLLHDACRCSLCWERRVWRKQWIRYLVLCHRNVKEAVWALSYSFYVKSREVFVSLFAADLCLRSCVEVCVCARLHGCMRGCLWMCKFKWGGDKKLVALYILFLK